MKKKLTAILLCIGMLAGMVTPLAADEQYAIPVLQEDDDEVVRADAGYAESGLNDEELIEDEPSVLSESLDSENDNLELPVPIVQKAVVPDGYIGIYTAEDLDYYSHVILDGNFILMNNIDLSEYENWVPIGSGGKAYTGIFDGNGYKISNIRITATDNSVNDCDGIGLFSYVYNATIQNLILENCKITVEYIVENVGTVCGKTRKSTVDNCIVSGSIKYVDDESQSIRMIGGICGCMLQSNIRNISNDVSLDIDIPNATQYIGGNIGYMGGTNNEDYTLENMHNVGEINCLSADIDCKGNITCGGNIGSVRVNEAELKIKNLTNSGKITCNNKERPCVGGVIGNLDAHEFANVKISNLQNTAIVTVNSDLFSTCGGIIGSYIMPTSSTGTTESNDISYITFSQLRNNGKITNSAKIPYTGGLFGEIGYSAMKNSNGNYSFVNIALSDSYNSGDIVVEIIKNNVGNYKYTSGIIGLAESIHDDSDNIDSWYSHLELNNIYNIGDITVLYEENDNTVSIHDIVCFYTNNSSENITSCYYPSNNNATNTVISGCTPLSEAEMQSASSFVGFDFDNVWEIGVTDGYPYPTLRNNPHNDGNTNTPIEPNIPNIPEDAVYYNGSYYKIYTISSNATGENAYKEANEHCTSMGGHLAVIQNQAENDFLSSYVQEQSITNAYFGYSDEAVEGTWVWVNCEETSSYVNWAYDEPDSTREDYGMFYFYGGDYFSKGQWNNGDFGYSTIGDDKNYICEWNVSESVTSSISTTFDTSTVTLQEGDTFDFDGIVSTTAEDGLTAVQIDIHKAYDDTVGITYTRKTNTDETSPLSGNSFDLSSIPSFKAGDTLTGTTQSITLSADTSWNIYLYAKDADGNTLGGSVVKQIDIVEKEVTNVIHAEIECTDSEDYAGNYRAFTVIFDELPQSAYLQFDNQYDASKWLNEIYCASNILFNINPDEIEEKDGQFIYTTEFRIHSEGQESENYMRKVRVVADYAGTKSVSEARSFQVKPIPERDDGNTIGYQYEQTSSPDESADKPVILNVTNSAGTSGRRILSVVNYDCDASASPFFWWKSDCGTFYEIADDFTEVGFIPNGSGTVTIYMGDGLGYVTSYKLTIEN